jgi:hypothetical protein
MFWGEEKCHSSAKNQTMIPLSFCPQLSHSLHSAIPAPSHVTQHSKQQLSESRELPLFNKQKGSFQYPNTAAGPHHKPELSIQHHISPTGLLPSIFIALEYFYTFVNSPMHATDLPHHSPLDFVSLKLPGKQCTLLCHSVHYQMPQNINKSVNTQIIQHF